MEGVMLTKAASCSPVTLVEVFHDIEIIVYGFAQALAIYSINGQELSNVSLIDIFGSHSTSGCTHTIGDSDIVVFGWKYIAVISCSSDAPNATIAYRSGEMRDYILDCRKVRTVNKNLCLIGYAQNIIELTDINSGETVAHFRSPHVCVLFSLSVLPNVGDSATLASGTAFGPVHVWKINLIQSDNDEACRFDTYETVNTLSGHTGVVFRLRWSANGRWLASVSDDRSVRVWDMENRQNSCVFVGWGHICRVWDVVFLGAEDEYLATSSEDACLKLWSWRMSRENQSQRAGEDTCVCTMRGHTKHIWRLAALHSGPYPATMLGQTSPTDGANGDTALRLRRAVEQLQHVTLLSAGNDGDIKLWPLAQHCVLSGHGVSDLVRTVRPCVLQSDLSSCPPQFSTPTLPFSLHCPVPEWRHENCVCIEERVTRFHTAVDRTCSSPHGMHNMSSRGSRRDHGAAGLFLCPMGRFCVIALLDGGLWLVDLIHCHGAGWVPVVSVGRGSGVTGADVHWAPLTHKGTESDCWRATVGCTHPDETVTITSLSISTKVVGSDCCVSVDGQDVWHTGGMGKGVNVWLSRSNEEGPLVVLVAGVRGVCRLWTIFPSSSGSLSAGPTLIVDLASARRDIVTAALVLRQSHQLQSGNGAGDGHRVNVALGDCRGNVTVASFDMSVLPVPPDAVQILCVTKAHGTEVVSCLSAVDGSHRTRLCSFCSLGHDGYMNIYHLTNDEPIGHAVISIASRLSCLPINSPDQIVSTGEGTAQLSLFVGGYEASHYVVWDVHRKYQLLRIDAGGWRRPHRMTIRRREAAVVAARSKDYFPELTFAYLAPLDRGTVLKCIGTSSRESSVESSLLPLHMGISGHGKVAYCGMIIPCGEGRPLLGVGGEDGTLKLFQLAALESASSLTQQQLSAFVHEAHMPSHSSIRAVGHSSRWPGRGIVVCAGGRLDWGVWSYDMSLMGTAEGAGSPYHVPWNALLRPLHSTAVESMRRRKGGNKKQKPPNAVSETGDESDANRSTGPVGGSDAQDHRILAVATCPLFDGHTSGSSTSDRHLIALCDSRGRMQLHMLDVGACCELEKEKQAAPSSDALQSADTSHTLRGVQALEEFSASEHPILCCSLQRLSSKGFSAEGKLHCDVYVAAMGDTTGRVALWLIGRGVSSWDDRPVCSNSQLLHSYSVHAMGANCLSLCLHSVSTSASSAMVELAVCSGGDDQAIGVASLALLLTARPTAEIHSTVDLQATVLSDTTVRVQCACGSAVKGIGCFDFSGAAGVGSFGLASVGYDQRLSLWEYVRPASAIGDSGESAANCCQYDLSVNGSANSKLPCPLKWRGGDMVNVGDVNSMTLMQTPSGRVHIAVIGEGFQEFHVSN